MLRSLLAALPVVDSDASYLAFVTEEGARSLASVASGVHLHIVPPRRGLRWELRGAAQAAHAAGADLLFTVRELVGRRSPPTVLHVFEPPAFRLSSGRPSDLGSAKGALKDRLLILLFRSSLRRAAAVTAGSATTAAWLREHHGIDATVILPGIDDAFFNTAVELPAQAQPYVFHLASGDARDRTDVLLDSLSLLGAAAPRLLVAGLGEPARIALAREAEERGLGGGVEPLAWVSDEELCALYRGALAYAHPSRYESYGGLAALEAMALGTPVVGFHAPGVTEALGGAALLVEQGDSVALAAGLRELVRDPELRGRLAKAGRQRVESLRWERAARELAVVFRRAITGSAN